MILSFDPGKPAVIRDMNRYSVLRVIESYGPISRAEIARRIGLSSPTVSAVVDYLLSRGLIREIGLGKSAGGRRPTLLTFNPRAGYVLGVDLGSRNLVVALSDLKGDMIGKEMGLPVSPDLGGDISNQLRPVISRLICKTGVDRTKVVGMGIAVPGIADPTTGIVHLAPALGWNRFPLGNSLSAELGIPVYVENDVNAAALGERLLGAGREFDDFVFVFIGTGIGAGIVINRELYRGHGNLAGEIGYLVVDPSWVQDKVPGFGCLESLASEAAILRKASERLRLNASITALGSMDDSDITFLFRLASMGDSTICAILKEASKYLAIGLANIFWVLSPCAMILGGMVSQAGGEVMVEFIKKELEQISPVVPKLYLSQLGMDAGILGATSVAVKEVKRMLLREDFSPLLGIS